MVEELLLLAHGVKIDEADVGVDRAVDHILLVWGDIHIGDSPADVLSIDLRLQVPVVGVSCVVQVDGFLTRAVVQVSFCGEASTVDPSVVSPDRTVVLVWDQALIVV